jgi:hypothetical protein
MLLTSMAYSEGSRSRKAEFLVQIENRDFGASLSQHFRSRTAQPGCAARDDGSYIVQTHESSLAAFPG